MDGSKNQIFYVETIKRKMEDILRKLCLNRMINRREEEFQNKKKFSRTITLNLLNLINLVQNYTFAVDSIR